MPGTGSTGHIVAVRDWACEPVIAQGGGPREGLLALGYAHWGPGQLDREMQENVWLSAPSDLPLLFDAEHDTKWRRAMAILHVDPVLLSGKAGRA